VKKNLSIYPPGATDANWFSLFNAVSFQVTLGAPMILYAKSIGASATVLGVISALTPLLTVCQIPAAHYLERFGYKRFILYGWGLRTFCIFGIAFVPLIAFLGGPGKIRLILAALFIFNLLRGLSSGAWLPWLTALIPEDLRGRFLSRDQFFVHIGSFCSLLTCAFLLEEKSKPWQFSAVFFMSAAGGWLSLLFLKRIPDIEPGEKLKRSNLRVPWREIIGYPPFFKLTLYVLLITVSAGCSGVFNIAFLKSQIHFGESLILFIITLYFLGALLALPLLGRVIDHTGSKAAMGFSMALICASFVVWFLLAGRVLPASLWMIGALYFIGGIAGSNLAVAQVRLMMSTMPEMGGSHFFAFFSVITSLGLGIAPVCWGMMIDRLNHFTGFTGFTGPVEWNKFSIYYLIQFGILAGNLAFTAALVEKKPRPAEKISKRNMLYGMELKRLFRFWQR
jgi:MFS family permease